MARREFRHSVVVQNDDLGGNVTRNYPLGVNPLSVLLICLRPLNDTGTLANFNSYLTMLASFTVNLMVQGESIIKGLGSDLGALAYFRQGVQFPQANHADTNNDRRCVVLPLFLGRMAYDPDNCLPEFKSGDVVLELTAMDSATGWDDCNVTVEAVELPGAKPKMFERVTTYNRTWEGTGDREIELQTGNLTRGILCYGTTGFTGGSPAPSWGRMAVRVDSQQVGYQSTDFEVAHGVSSLWGRQPPTFDAHYHRLTTVNAGDASGAAVNIGNGYEKYAFLDCDPTRDDSFSIDTAANRRLTVGANVETANAVRVLHVEAVDSKKLRSS